MKLKFCQTQQNGRFMFTADITFCKYDWVREAELAADFCLKSFNASLCCRARHVLPTCVKVLAQNSEDRRRQELVMLI